jgi:hypothetical protein
MSGMAMTSSSGLIPIAVTPDGESDSFTAGSGTVAYGGMVVARVPMMAN